MDKIYSKNLITSNGINLNNQNNHLYFMNNFKRWGIALAGVLLQIALGSVYAWSVFRVPLAKQFNWTISEVTLTFTISILSLGFAAFFGGLWLKRVGPRIVAMTGGALYGIGVFLASYSYHGLWWLYLTYGVIGGIGLGFAYIVPISVLVKWFPDRRGLMTGIAVGGFGRPGRRRRSWNPTRRPCRPRRPRHQRGHQRNSRRRAP